MRHPLVSLSCIALLVACGSASAQSGTFSYFGRGCDGTGRGPGACLAQNGSGGTNTNTALKNEYAFGFTATEDLTLIGMEFFTQAFGSADVDVPVHLCRKESSRTVPRTSAEVSSTMTVTGTLQFHRAMFANTLTIAKGETFWVVQGDTENVRAPGLGTGTAPTVPTFWRRAGTSTSWTASSVIRYPAVRVLCSGTGPSGTPPLMTHTGAPNLGTSMQFEVLHCAANRPATMIYGLSDTTWGSVKLPFDLGVLGGTGCTLFASAEAQLSMGLTDAAGTVSQTLAVPFDFSLYDVKFYVQAYVSDPSVTRSLKAAFSQAGVGKIGS